MVLFTLTPKSQITAAPVSKRFRFRIIIRIIILFPARRTLASFIVLFPPPVLLLHRHRLNSTSFFIASFRKMKGTLIKNDVALLSYKRLSQPHNVYNIFFMLERQRLIQMIEESCGKAVADHQQQLSYNLSGYDFLSLPDLPSRFQHVRMPEGWYVPGKNSKRKHVKSHGCKFLLFDLTE
jgi:hypothetical protein